MQFVPKNLYYKIKEVCEIVGVEAHVLRFWETEFPSLAPPKSKSGQRTYRPRDIELLLRIRKLLYADGFTIAGARKQLSMRKPAEPSVEDAVFLSQDLQRTDQGIGTQNPKTEASKGANIMLGIPRKSSLDTRAKSIKGSGTRSLFEDAVAEETDPKAETPNLSSVKVKQPEKPSSEHLKRVQSELENILTLLDRE